MGQGSDDLVGRYVADRYRVVHKLGEGGMGDVYAAEDLRADAMIALKVMRRETLDPSAPERFLREAQALARLRSPNVVRISDFDRDMDLGLLFVAMELALGDDLSRLLYSGRLRPALALRVIHQTANGLAAAHAAGIIHRDLKPSNLKLSPRPDRSFRVKILDFGLVRDKHSKAVLTDLGTAPGTLSYTPPEILQELELDPRGDLYSLGVMAYEMLTGLVPFSGATPVEVAGKHLREEPAPLARETPELLPVPLVELVEHLMVKDREKRVGSAEEVLSLTGALLESPHFAFAVDHMGESKNPFAAWDLLPHV